MLEKLFTSKTRIKILEYLFFIKKETHLREISRILKLSSGAVKREIDNLVEINILKKQENRISLNELNPIVDDLKQIFLKTEFIAFPIKKALQKTKIDFALIFGSFAKGNFNFNSDIDLLVIGNTREDLIYKLLAPVENLVHRDINPVVWDLNELIQNKNKGFVKDIAKKSFIMIIGDKNEFQKIVE